MSYLKSSLFFVFVIIFLDSCSKPTGCKNIGAINYDPSIEVADASCVYPSLSLDWTLRVGNAPFEINRIYTINGKKTAFKQFQFYISELVLERSDQSLLEFPNRFPLVKEEATNFDLGEVPVETFNKIRFNVGVDLASNNAIGTYLTDPSHDLYKQHPDTMHYANVVDGFLFLKMVGKVDRNGDGIPNENEAFDFRIGTNQLLQAIELTINKDITQEIDSIKLSIDIEQLLNGVDFQTDQYTNSINNLPLANKIANNIVGAVAVQ